MRRSALGVVGLLLAGLLAGCGGGEPAKVPKGAAASRTCRPQGTYQQAPAPTIKRAVQPLVGSGERVRIETKLKKTAQVLITDVDGRVHAQVSLLLVDAGWEVTAVTRC